ncbi:MAG: galactokinase [Patescibacteria group bacterium]|nr:galactokinase [Patescibacteria group bacterium]
MRITLAGGGTDVQWYSQQRGGAWISAAIDQYVFVYLHRPEDWRDIIAPATREDGIVEQQRVRDYRELRNPIIRESLDLTGVTCGIDIAIQADVSARSGLGGSGAFEVGLLNALHTYKNGGASTDPETLAREACEIEMQRLKQPVGPQDQYIAALGGIRYFEMDQLGNVESELLNLPYSTVAELEENLLFFRTGLHRDAASVLADQKEKVGKKDPSAEDVMCALDDIKALGLDVKRWLLEGDVDAFGKSLDVHWRIKQRLSSKVSNPQIDEWYEEAIKAGALGGKIMGAGGGGWFAFYVSSHKRGFRERMSEIGLEERKISFEPEGTKVVYNHS